MARGCGCRRYLLWFLGGMALAVLQAMGVRCIRVRAFAAGGGVLLHRLHATGRRADDLTPSLREAIAKAGFYAVIAALLIAPRALAIDGWYTRMLASRPVVFLGEISYEIFLMHLLTMEIVMVEILHFPIYTGSMVILFVVTFAVTVPVAWLLHRFTRVRPS